MYSTSSVNEEVGLVNERRVRGPLKGIRKVQLYRDNDGGEKMLE